MPILHPLRSIRQQQNLTIAQLANLANVSSTTIWRAEHGRSVNAESRRRLCAFFNVNSRELGLVESADDPSSPSQEPMGHSLQVSPQPAISKVSQQPPQHAVATRKQQVGAWLVHVTSDLAEIYDLDWSLVDSLQVILQCLQRLPLSARELMIELSPTPPGDQLATLFRDELAHVDHEHLYISLMSCIDDAWQLFHTLPPARVLLAAQTQRYVVHQLQAAISREYLQRLDACLYTLIGGTLFFKGQYLAAQHAHEQAFMAASGVADTWNMAQSLSWQAIVASKFGRYIEAMHALESSLHLVEHHDDERHLRLRAHLLADWAYNASLHGERQLAREKLSASAVLLEGLGPSEEFDQAQWHEIAGNCALKHGAYNAAIAHFEEALAQLPVAWLSRRLLTLIPLARALALHHEREGSISVAEHATTLLQTLNSHMLSENFTIYLHTLQQAFPRDPSVGSFITSSHQMLDLESLV